MTYRIKLSGCIALLTATVACTDDPVGTLRNEASFSEATTSNQFAQQAYIDGRALQNLGAKFARETPSMINFEFNSAQLDQEARATLARQAAWINTHPGVTFKVFGHTDLVGSDGFNRRLGQRRAQTAVRYLVSQGVARSRLKAVSSFGETQPVVFTQEPERKNRRTVTQVSGVTSRYVGTGMDGKRAATVYNEYVSDSGSEIVAGDEVN